MILRGIKITAAAIVLAIVLAVAAAAALAGWVLHTRSGTAWAFERLRTAIPGELGSARVDGTFAGGMQLTGFRYAGPGVVVSAARLELAIDPDLFPPALTVKTLDAGDVHVALRPSPEPRKPERPFSPARLALPFELLVTDLRVEGFRLSSAAGDELLAIDRAALAGRWHESISLSRLDVQSPLGAVRGSASLSLARPFPADATLELEHALAQGDVTVPLTVTADATGDLGRLHLRLESAEPAVTVEGRLEDLLEAPAWALEAQSPILSWPLSGAEPAITVGELTLSSRGSASGYSLSADGTLTALADTAVRFALAGSGDTRGIEVERLELSGEPVAADAEGAVRWGDGFGIEVDARVARLDPAAFTPHWPAGMPVAGRAAGQFRPGKVELRELEAAVPGTDRTLAARGVIDLAARVVNLDLDWRNLQWPLAGDDWRVRSSAGEVVVAGSPDEWTLEGRIGLAAPDLPPGAFVLSGQGSREEATLVVRDSEVLGGRVAGRIHYARPDGGRWVANLSASGIDTAGLFPDWPGRLDAELATSGRVQPLELTVDVQRLSGSLRGRPLTGSGGFRFARGNLAVQELALASGDAELRADGSLRGTQGLKFELGVPALAAVMPGAAGSLEAQGTLNFSKEFPRAELDVAGRGLAWGGWRAGTLRLKATEGDVPLLVALEAEALTLGGFELERLETDLEAGETRQRLAATATLGGRKLALALDGRFADWRRPLDSGWNGHLETLTAELMPDLTLGLEEPAAVTFGPERVALGRACLAQPAGPARVCAAASHAGANDYELTAELTAIPVGLARLALDTELEFTQTLDGSLSLMALPGRRLSADARIDIAPGRIFHPANRRMNLDTRAGVFRLDLDDGRVLLAELRLPVGTATAIDARFGLADVQRGQASPIEGRVVVDVSDIGVLTALVPSLPRADGRLDIDLAIAGTLDAPAVTGDASLTNGALTFAPLGLELEDIELKSRIREGNRIDLTSTFRAGEGTGRLSSSTNGLGEEDLRLRLTGDQLTVVNLPQLNVVADMNVGVGVSGRELTLNGWVSIPHARISPRELAPGRVSESEDVVIVASESGEEEVETEAAPPLSLRGRVGLTLGDDVLIDFDAAETKLTGAVAFDWNGPPMPTATGEYKVTGRFEAYGQLLEITEGSVRFPSVPANNPQLRIRAEREIFGNPQIRTAGVLVSGSARDPELEVYTNPETTEERALTLLVTGSDFDYEQGVGAVDVGTYIAPNLFLSYGIGLFDRENVISLRYDIARGFGIKATSGKSTEGIDLSYTFER